MNLHELLKEKLRGRNLEEIAGILGYRNRQQGAHRIHSMIAAERLEEIPAGFDFRFSDRELLLVLCGLLEIDLEFCEESYSRMQAERLAEERRLKPYHFIDTGFKRTTQPIFALAVMEGRRYLRIPDEIGTLPFEAQLERLQEIVRAHYSESHDEDLPPGELPMWGKIRRYIYHYDATTILALDPQGNVIGPLPEHHPSKSVVTIKGRPLSLGQAEGPTAKHLEA